MDAGSLSEGFLLVRCSSAQVVLSSIGLSVVLLQLLVGILGAAETTSHGTASASRSVLGNCCASAPNCWYHAVGEPIWWDCNVHCWDAREHMMVSSRA